MDILIPRWSTISGVVDHLIKIIILGDLNTDILKKDKRGLCTSVIYLTYMTNEEYLTMVFLSMVLVIILEYVVLGKASLCQLQYCQTENLEEILQGGFH